MLAKISSRWGECPWQLNRICRDLLERREYQTLPADRSGLNTLASNRARCPLNESPESRDLSRSGFIVRTSRNRTALQRTYACTSQDNDILRFLNQFHCVINRVVLGLFHAPRELLRNRNGQDRVIGLIGCPFEKRRRQKPKCRA